MLVIVEVLADQAGSHGDGQIGHRTLELGDSGLLVSLDGSMGLLDHTGSLSLGLGGDIGLDGLARLLGVGDDLRGLRLGFLQLALVLGEHALAFNASVLGLLESVLDGGLALDKHAFEQRPTEFRQDDPQDDERNEHGDKLIHLRQDSRNAAAFIGKCLSRKHSACRAECDGCAAATTEHFVLNVQLACLLSLAYRSCLSRKPVSQ